MLSLVGFLLIYHYAWIYPAWISTLFIITMVAGVYAVGGSKRHRVIAVSIGALEIVFMLAALTGYSPYFGYCALAFLAVFFGFMLVSVLMYVMRGKKVTRDKIFGAVCVYLLIGFSWASVYRMIFMHNPAAFSGTEVLEPGDRHFDFVYYSFETICTVGFGDIQPVSGFARSITILEALTGVLYIAVLISRLMSLYIRHSEE